MTWPTAGFEHGEDKFPELLALVRSEDLSTLFHGEDASAAVVRFDFQASERIGRQDALLVRPSVSPLHRQSGVPAACFPFRVAIEPLGEVERSHGDGWLPPIDIPELVEIEPVEIESLGTVVLLAVVEEQVANHRDDKLNAFRYALGTVNHQFVEGIEDCGRRFPFARQLLIEVRKT
jgi:hypothetical protein